MFVSYKRVKNPSKCIQKSRLDRSVRARAFVNIHDCNERNPFRNCYYYYYYTFCASSYCCWRWIHKWFCIRYTFLWRWESLTWTGKTNTWPRLTNNERTTCKPPLYPIIQCNCEQTRVRHVTIYTRVCVRVYETHFSPSLVQNKHDFHTLLPCVCLTLYPLSFTLCHSVGFILLIGETLHSGFSFAPAMGNISILSLASL